MDDLTEFLLARIGEDEAAARQATAGPWQWVTGRGGLPGLLESTGASATHWVAEQSFQAPTVVLATNQGVALRVRGRDAAHIADWHPTRVLAECDAKRRIVQRLAPPADGPDTGVLRLLALPYAEHADYREDWRP
jgi:Family of unknown function (DUF6221)